MNTNQPRRSGRLLKTCAVNLLLIVCAILIVVTFFLAFVANR
jgi:hypothetical protein